MTSVPLILLSGFLGAGKTTWLRNLLQQDAGERIAVLINEFGEVGIDHLLVEPIAPDTVLLDSGCICCQIRGELKDAILMLLSRVERGEIPRFERIVVETTGLADPAQIQSTFLFDPVLRHQVVLEQVLVVVDALNCVNVHAHQPEWAPQVAAADTILISKTGLLSEDKLPDLREKLTAINPFAKQQRTEELISLEELTGEQRKSPAFACAPVPSGEVASAATLSLTLEEEIDWTTFVIWLAALVHCHGQNLLRVKCLLNTTTLGQVLIDGVGHTLHPPQHPSTSMSTSEPSRLVFISRGLDLEKLQESFEAFVNRGSKNWARRQ
ncbi:CobW family GTP-binding protein [Roseibium sp. SCP14]|uniref:CobW family GTP-binding protein n=1 Tax=Roseibium sp. SCP14 TaxID=3141375 RepID=UPI00333C66BB